MRRAAVMALVTLVAAAPAAATMFITTCRQNVPPGETAILAADLVCGSVATWPFSALGVRLDSGATLELDGHSITGDGTGVGIDCEAAFGAAGRRRPCRIVGPGEVSHFELGVGVVGSLSVEDVTARYNRFGFAVQKCCRLDVADVVADANEIAGVSARILTGVGLQANGNGEVGVDSFRFKLSGLTATGNGPGGGVRGRGRLANSIVVGNAGFDGTYDLLAYPRIRTRRTMCGSGVRLRTIFGPGGAETTKVLGSFDCR